MGAFKENNCTRGYLAQARQKMTTKGEHSRISEDEATPPVMNSTHEHGAGQQMLPGRSCNRTQQQYHWWWYLVVLFKVNFIIGSSYKEFTMSQQPWSWRTLGEHDKDKYPPLPHRSIIVVLMALIVQLSLFHISLKLPCNRIRVYIYTPKPLGIHIISCLWYVNQLSLKSYVPVQLDCSSLIQDFPYGNPVAIKLVWVITAASSVFRQPGIDFSILKMLK